MCAEQGPVATILRKRGLRAIRGGAAEHGRRCGHHGVLVGGDAGQRELAMERGRPGDIGRVVRLAVWKPGSHMLKLWEGRVHE